MSRTAGTRFHVYVDMSNLFIEGQRVSAVRAGSVPSVRKAQEQDILDRTWRLDLGAFRTLLDRTLPGVVARAVAFGSTTENDRRFWQAVGLSGLIPLTLPRLPGRPEKGVDVQLAINVMGDCSRRLQPGDQACLVTGDNDFAPLLRKLRNDGIHTHVLFWEHAGRELRQEATKFVALDSWFGELTFSALALPFAA